ncbi:hypothetical protein O3M35_010799 [Rhynocoris fuscipes]|uniref:Neurochondrin n=1 Tax=Rhynocoris fuscipes TaxID=488301 RepID=A0AAW1D413_9HEMI
MEDQNVPESVKHCVNILEGAKSDTEKFTGLFAVTKLVKSDECNSKTKELLFKAIGINFLKKLLVGSLSDCPAQVTKSVALAVLSALSSDRTLCTDEDMLSMIPLFLNIVQQADADDFDDNLIIVSEAYECLNNISQTNEGRSALIKEGVVKKMVDIYSLQSFQTDEALNILVSLVQQIGSNLWNNNDENFHPLINKVALDFETDHSERKFELCDILRALIHNRPVNCNTNEESWPQSIYKALNDILTSRIGKDQRDPALKLAATMVESLGIEWTLSDETKPKQFLLLLVHLTSVEVRMQLEDRNWQRIVSNAELITSCFIVIELSVAYFATDVLELDQKEKQQLYTALKGAFNAILNTLTKIQSKVKSFNKEENIFMCAMVRVVSAWLAQETSALRNQVNELLPFILSIANDTFYAYRSWYVSEKSKNIATTSGPPDVLRVLLPGLCHFTVEEKGRKIMLDCKQEEVLLECLNFHWSIVNYKKPPVPKSERLKARLVPEPELPESLIEQMADSRAAIISMCNIFMNIIVLEPKFIEKSTTFSSLLKFVLNNLTELKNIPENLVLHGNLAVLGLLLLKQQSNQVKKNDFSICRYIQSTIRFLWDAYNVDESNDACTLVVSMTYKKYWMELIELWFLGMQTISVVLTLIPWISEFIVETGWAQGIVIMLKKVKAHTLPSNIKSAYEDFLCHLVETNADVIPMFKENDVLTVCRNHLFMNLGKLLFGD